MSAGPGPAGPAVHDPGAGDAARARRDARPLVYHLVKLARPRQWTKSAFVLVGPLYRLGDSSLEGLDWSAGGVAMGAGVLLTAAAFALASSGLYVFNDLADVEEDRAHPRKRHRPIASGAVSPGLARAYGSALLLAAFGLALLTPGGARAAVLILLGAHAANVLGYSALFKRIAIVDVVSLSMGFVLRVIAGCAAVGVMPSTWLLNATLFVSMFLAFGKRLGERRTMGSAEGAARARGVQAAYSDHMLRMVVVVTGVAALLTYAAYVNDREADYAVGGLNLLWLTVLPAMYGLLRCITLVERGTFDDPTELATKDRGFQAAVAVFGVVTAALVLGRATGRLPDGAEAGAAAGDGSPAAVEASSRAEPGAEPGARSGPG